MRPDLLNRLRSTAKAAVISLAILATVLLSVTNAWSQQKQDAKNKQTTKKPAARKKRQPEKKIDLVDSLKGTIQTGVRFRSVKGDRPGKFEENRDFPKSVFVRSFLLNFESVDSPFFVDFKALEFGERDERFSAEVGKVGTFRTEIMWDQIPKYYSTGRTFHLAAAPGLLVVNPDLRARLQAVPDAGVAASQLGPQLPNLVRQEVQNQASINLRVRRDQFLLAQSYHPNENWEFFVRAQNLRLSGTRPRTTGTFARDGVGPAGDGVWEDLGVELPEPIQYRTTNITLGVQYSRPKWRVGVDYNLSLFRNSIPSLTWENPFRVTDALAVRPAFSVGRNRFVRAQLALPPDNDYQSISVHGSVDLPRTTQLRGAISWGKGTQNERTILRISY